MNPNIKKSIIDVINANLVQQPNPNSWEAVEHKEKPQPQIATPTWASAQSKGRGIISAIRIILGKKQAAPQTESPKPEYTSNILFTMTWRPISDASGTAYTLSYNGTIFEERTIYQAQEKLTPAQQDIIDIYNAFVKQYDTQLLNGYGPKQSISEMMITKYLKSLQK